MKNKLPPYKTLEKVFRKLYDLEQVQSVLQWDSAVVMPKGGAKARGEQLATLKSIHHAILTDPGVEELLQKAQDEQRNLSGWQRANLKEMQRVFKHTNAVPRKLVKELSRAGSVCEMTWREARAANDFKMLAGPLKIVIEIVKEIAAAKAEALGCSPYDALLDQYEPGQKSEQLDIVFSDLRNFLPSFLSQVMEKQAAQPASSSMEGVYDIEKQRKLAKILAERVGFDFDHGRIDESHHPFCGGYPSDIRITTRYNTHSFMPALMSVLHESGHAIYEAGLPQNWRGQPVGQARGMGIHESQSLLIEMQAGRSKEFLSFLAPFLGETLGTHCTAEELYKHCTKVQPSLIRVDADEVTYPLHVILRYYIEKYLIAGEMSVDDLPDAWRQGMEKFVGIVPDNDANGCMQDIHWMDGTFGYFPTYTLGAIYAAQIFAAAKRASSDIMPSLSRGEFLPLKTWLTQNIHDKASRYDKDELMIEATGSALDLDLYKAHLKERYLGE